MTACRLEESVVLEIAQAANVCAGREEQNKAEQSRAEQRWRGASETRPRLRRTARLHCAAAPHCTVFCVAAETAAGGMVGGGVVWCGVVPTRLDFVCTALGRSSVR